MSSTPKRRKSVQTKFPSRRTLVEHASISWGGASVAAKILLITAVVVGITASITGINSVFPIIEPLAPAWREWVRQYVRVVTDPMGKSIQATAVAIDKQTLFQLEYYRDNAKKDPAAGTSPEVQARIELLNKQIDALERQICLETNCKATGL